MENSRSKFRVWDRGLKKMSYDPDWNIRADGRLFYGNADFSKYGADIMWSIGLSDENGKLIYEKDVVKGICSKEKARVCQGIQLENKLGKEIIGIIQYSQTYCQFYFTTNSITYLSLNFGIENIEIIGNDFQKPELLNNDK